MYKKTVPLAYTGNFWTFSQRMVYLRMVTFFAKACSQDIFKLMKASIYVVSMPVIYQKAMMHPLYYLHLRLDNSLLRGLFCAFKMLNSMSGLYSLDAGKTHSSFLTTKYVVRHFPMSTVGHSLPW